MTETLSANHGEGKAATGQAKNPTWITWGNGRRLPHDWAAVHAMALDHGYAFVRVGSVLVGFPADAQEGRA